MGNKSLWSWRPWNLRSESVGFGSTSSCPETYLPAESSDPSVMNPSFTITPGSSTPRFGAKRASLAVAVIAALASLAGLMPIVAWLERLPWLTGFAVFIFFLVWLTGGRPQAIALQKPRVRSVAPTPSEFMLAAAGAVLPAATAGILGFIVYGVCYFLTKLEIWVLGLFGVPLAHDPRIFAFYPTIFFLAVFGLAFVVTLVRRIQQTLYPETADGRSAFYPLVAQGLSKVTLRILAVAVPVALTAVFVALGVKTTWIYVVLQIAFVYCAGPTWQRVSQTHTTAASPQIEDAVAKLFRATGCEVMVSPASPVSPEHPETHDLGALLSVVDLIAEGPSGAFAVEIASSEQGDSERADIARASNLQTTAWRLQEYRERLGIQAETVRPVLVLVGRGAGPNLESFSARGGISIIQIPAEAVEKIVAGDSETVSSMAADLLSPLMADRRESSPLPMSGSSVATT